MPKVDVIIPIYGSYDLTRNCIESVLKFIDETQRLVLINDKSPEEKITEYLRKIKKEFPKVILIENQKNKGFVGTCNSGMALSKENDVILLNSDTVVTKNWVNKLRDRSYSNENIGTVTPFSNSATLFSYPKYLEKNEMPDDLDPETLNSYFEIAGKNNKEITSLPTGMGYCLYIKRKVIDAVGFFDEEVFGKGYGEENDFCMRAYYAGYLNVECPNTFIYHFDGGSFGQEKNERIDEAIKKVNKRHPYYLTWLNQFIKNNPFLDLYRKVDIIRYSSNEKPGLLLVLHEWGGGTEKYVKEIANSSKENGWQSFILYPFSGGARLVSGDNEDNFELIFQGQNWYKDLLVVLKTININHLHYNQFIGASDYLFDLADDLGVEKDFTFHDFYTFCPRIHLIDTNGLLCGRTGSNTKCKNCLFLKNNSNWMKKYMKFLKGCRKLFSPSQNTANYINKYFPKLKIDVIYHFEKNNFINETLSPDISEKIKVGIIGNLPIHKGGLFLKECVEYSSANNLPIEWYLYGPASDDVILDQKIITIFGKYNGFDELLEIIKINPYDITFLPAIWPETFNYVLSESWFLKKPVLSTNLGAIAERINKIDGGWLIDYPLSAEVACNKIIKLKNNPKEIEQKTKNIIKKFKPDHIFQWQKYYSGIKEKNFITPELTESSLKIAEKNAFVQKNSHSEKELEKAISWINHLEKDINFLKEEIKRVKDRRIIRIGNKIKNILKIRGKNE